MTLEHESGNKPAGRPTVRHRQDLQIPFMRRAWTRLRYALEFLGFRLAELILGALPVETASAVSGRVWQWLAPLSSRHARALANLARAFPDKPEPERRAIAAAMWDNIGRTFGEAFHLNAIAASDRVQFANLDLFERWATRPGGKVACAGHLGNWELAILGISQRGLRPWSIYQRVKNPHVERRILDMRAFLYTGGLVPKNPTLVRTFMRIIREGGTIGFLSDQREHTGLDVPFFGSPAPSTTFPALLARSVDAPVLVACMRRLSGVRFVLTYALVERPTTLDRKGDIEATTTEIQGVFESFIRAYPEQWMWAHRRWG